MQGQVQVQVPVCTCVPLPAPVPVPFWATHLPQTAAKHTRKRPLPPGNTTTLGSKRVSRGNDDVLTSPTVTAGIDTPNPALHSEAAHEHNFKPEHICESEPAVILYLKPGTEHTPKPEPEPEPEPQPDPAPQLGLEPGPHPTPK